MVNGGIVINVDVSVYEKIYILNPTKWKMENI